SFNQPETLTDVYSNIRELRQEDHPYKTLVIDTLDRLESLIFVDICTRNSWKNIEEPGYQKGYKVSLDDWRKLLADLDSLRREKSMEIILIAHTAVIPFSNPAGPDYDRYELNIYKKSAAIIKDWTDVMLFACYEESVR